MGKIVCENADKYNHLTKKGPYIFENNSIYEGYWNGDIREGIGKWILEDGS